MNEEDTEVHEDEYLDTGLLPAEELDDREFVAFRVPIGRWARHLVAEIIKDLLDDEERQKVRARKRRDVDQRTFEATVAAIICDVVHRELSKPEGWTSIPFDKRLIGRGWRYCPAALNTKFPDIVRALVARDWIELDPGYHKHPFREGNPSKRTRIRASEMLRRNWIEGASLAVADFDIEEVEELILLKRHKDGFWDEGGLIDYEDNETTHRYREELRRINRWLRAASIDFQQPPDSAATVDLTSRRLRRTFNDGSFERGGRMYGAFWIPMKSKDRLAGLRINRQPVAYLDYGQMYLRILYGMAQLRPSWTDGYRVPFLEGHRDGVKKLLSAMLFRESRIERYPEDVGALFPAGLPVSRAAQLIEEFHAPVRSQFFRGIGLELMFRESSIMVEVLLRLIDLQIVALPVHDAIVVAESDRDTAHRVMLEVFLGLTSLDGVVGISSSRTPQHTRATLQ